MLGDGAAWDPEGSPNQASLHFGDSHQTVDWYHAKQHLIAAAHLLKEDGSRAFRRWLNSRETLLYQGQAGKIASELDKAAQKQHQHAEELASGSHLFPQQPEAYELSRDVRGRVAYWERYGRERRQAVQSALLRPWYALEPQRCTKPHAYSLCRSQQPL